MFTKLNLKNHKINKETWFKAKVVIIITITIIIIIRVS